MGIFLTVLPLAVGGTAAVLTMDAMAQYSALPQPPLAPPAWVFPAVWTVLYLLLGAASRRVYRCRRFSASTKSQAGCSCRMRHGCCLRRISITA